MTRQDCCVKEWTLLGEKDAQISGERPDRGFNQEPRVQGNLSHGHHYKSKAPWQNHKQNWKITCRHWSSCLGFQVNIPIACCSDMIYRCQEGGYAGSLSFTMIFTTQCICTVWPESTMHDRGGMGWRAVLVLSKALFHYTETISYFNLHNWDFSVWGALLAMVIRVVSVQFSPLFFF